MQYTYTSEKQKFEKNGVEMFYLHFANGDSIPFKGQELLDLSIKLYDNLIADGNGFSPVAESGRIVLDVAPKQPKYGFAHVYNESEFKKDRKTYIEKRCVEEGGLCAVEFCDDLNWGRTVYGDLSAEMQDGKLVLTYFPKRSGGASDGTAHAVSLRNVTKNGVRRILLDFENCENFVVYDDEIAEVKLQFKPVLKEGSDRLNRCVKSGYLAIKIDKTIQFRTMNFNILPHPTPKQLEKRLVGSSKKYVEHDICHLYVWYQDEHEECLEIDDIRPEEELARLAKAEEEGRGEGDPDFIGGYCQRQDDGSIKIMFGKSLYGKSNLN